MPDTIAIICTLDEIVPQSLGDPHNRHFTFNISVSLTNDSAGSPPVPDVFQPWKWKRPTSRSVTVWQTSKLCANLSFAPFYSETVPQETVPK